MGLDIRSQSDKDYHYSYSGLHYIRWMGYRAVGGRDDYLEWHEGYYGKFGNTEPFEITGKYEEAAEKFKNLYEHSDCDCTYTIRGRIGTNTSGLQTGNSKKLLEELKFIKEELPKRKDTKVTDRDWYVFNMFYDVVEDVVTNYDGKIQFC